MVANGDIQMNMNVDEPVEGDSDMRNDEWFKQNYLYLIQDYPNMWIAVQDQKVVAHGNNRYQVSSDAKKAGGDRPFSLYFIEQSGILP